jgi:uncharacterized protein YybS (DUF2232 family)
VIFLILAIAGPIVVAAWIHHGYAWRNYRTIRAAVPPARRVWLSRLGDLVRVLAIAVVVLALAWILSEGPQRGD